MNRRTFVELSAATMLSPLSPVETEPTESQDTEQPYKVYVVTRSTESKVAVEKYVAEANTVADAVRRVTQHLGDDFDGHVSVETEPLDRGVFAGLIVADELRMDGVDLYKYV